MIFIRLGVRLYFTLIPQFSINVYFCKLLVCRSGDYLLRWIWIHAVYCQLYFVLTVQRSEIVSSIIQINIYCWYDAGFFQRLHVSIVKPAYFCLHQSTGILCVPGIWHLLLTNEYTNPIWRVLCIEQHALFKISCRRLFNWFCTYPCQKPISLKTHTKSRKWINIFFISWLLYLLYLHMAWNCKDPDIDSKFKIPL